MNEELKIIISAEIDKLRSELKTAQGEVKGFAKNSESGFSKFGKAAGTAGKAVAVGMAAAAGAIAAGAGALIGLAESTREYRTEQAKLITAFETAGASAETAKETYNDLYRVLGDSGQATEAAQNLAKLTTNEQDLAEWTRICQGAYATFGDSMPIESLAEAANETAKTGEITGALADALNWAGVSEDEFAEQLFYCNTEAERERLIRGTLNGLYGEAADNYETTAGSILSANEAQAKLTESMAALGAATEPVITIFKSQFATMLADIVPSFDLFSQGLQDMINGVAGGSEKMSEGITGAVNTIIGAITNLIPTLIPIGIEVILALSNGIISALPVLIQAVVGAIPTLITGIVNGFQMIVEALPSIVKTIADALPTVIPTLINGIVDMVLTLVNNLESIVQPIIDAAPGVIIAFTEALTSNVGRLIDGIITLVMIIVETTPQILQGIVDSIPETCSLIIQAILNNLPKIIAGLIKVTFGITKSLPQILGSLVQGIVNTFVGIWDAVGKVFGNVGNWFKNKFSGAATGIKNAFSGITSFFSNIWNSIKNIFSKIGSTIGSAITNTVKKAVNGVLSTAAKIINGFIGAINTAISVINGIPGVNIRTLQKLSIPQLERGGVLKKGQVGLLEGNGTEAVVPLEKNTEWLDKIAARLNASSNSNRPIILQVDGKTFAKTSIDSINQYTRQTGKLALNLV